jgi:hypothetical protein
MINQGDKWRRTTNSSFFTKLDVSKNGCTMLASLPQVKLLRVNQLARAACILWSTVKNSAPAQQRCENNCCVIFVKCAACLH